ncbi:MAG: hypothetical protein IPK13_07000 [Deltaproteobacteria bacterium]|nr:hypothetical protein [Deltaproteobacteria bacterium]
MLLRKLLHHLNECRISTQLAKDFLGALMLQADIGALNSQPRTGRL